MCRPRGSFTGSSTVMAGNRMVMIHIDHLVIHTLYQLNNVGLFTNKNIRSYMEGEKHNSEGI